MCELTKQELVPVLDRFTIETNFCECDPATLLRWTLWLQMQIQDEEQFKRIVREKGIADAIGQLTLPQIRAAEVPSWATATISKLERKQR